MTVLLKRQLAADEFQAWALEQPRDGHGKYELIDGYVVMQQSEKALHWEAKAALYSAFREAIKRAGLPCFAVVDGASVRIAEKKVYRSDGLVYCGERVEPDSLEVNNPVIVFEVLSEDSVDRDYGEKLPGYFTLPSLYHYLIVDPARRAIVHHRRGQGDELLTRVSKCGTLTFDPPGLEIEIADVFERS